MPTAAHLLALSLLSPLAQAAPDSVQSVVSSSDTPASEAERSLAAAPAGLLRPSRGAEPGPAIINGESASEDDYPMTGGLIVKGTMDAGSFGTFPIPNMFICSSTLIAPDVVLTAAHCIDPDALTGGLADFNDVEYHWSRLADLTDYNGTADLEAPAGAAAAWDWVMHPSWDMSALGLGLNTNYDIALVFLSEPILDIQPAILPTASEAGKIEEGMDVVAVGWGQQTATDIWETPPDGTIQLKQMGVSFIAELAEGEFKVGDDESDVRKCHGDSGGPSFADIGDSDEVMRIIGVTSHAYDESDCFETGGVDTRVDLYLEWLDSEMRSRCDDGSRAWCDEPGIVPAEFYEAGGGSGDDGSTDEEGGSDGIDGGSDGTAEEDEVDGSDEKDTGGCSVGALGAAGLPALFALGAVLRRRED